MSLRGYRVYTCRLRDGTFSVLVESTNHAKTLLIQSGAILEQSTEAAETLKRSYAKVADGYALMGIIRLKKDEAYLILIIGVLSVGQLYDNDIYKVTGVQFVPLNWELTDTLDTHLVELQRLLSAGIFYYAHAGGRAPVYDVTLARQKRYQGSAECNEFFWNRNLCFPFTTYNLSVDDWVAKCMCGAALIRTIYVTHHTAKVAILSRLSSERVGTRFNVRGANDDGSVANFVETEQLIIFGDRESAYVQVRGSVPLFWDQPGLQVGSHKVRLKPVEVSMVACERHYKQLRRGYGDVTTVNLLGSKEGERLLSKAFVSAHKSLGLNSADFVSFDYHAKLKTSKLAGEDLLRQLASRVEATDHFALWGHDLQVSQKGCIRTNCLDCLDRTNRIQTLIGLKVLRAQLDALQVDKVKENISQRFIDVVKELWQKNGDLCSVIYTGTGALEGKSKLKDAGRSLARTIQNNLMDTAKQDSFDVFLFGQTFGDMSFDRANNMLNPSMIKECAHLVEDLVARRSEFLSVNELRVFAGTWNVNGGKNVYNVAFRHEQSLQVWLFPQLLNAEPYDLVIVGLEEIVDLNASNIMKASTTNQRIWRDGIRKALEMQTEGRASYVVLACEQLVGVCILVYARLELLSRMRDLAIAEVKTGLGGAAGNKGSIAVRLTVDSTSLCCVCSHFAAGQNEVLARNEDYHSTMRRIRFPHGRSIASHDVIIWVGDFNYRISMLGEEVKSAVRVGNFATLKDYDQLNQQRALGQVFEGFHEGALDFAPTYKYDTFSDDYDTSEKCRAPAWTDRVLWRDTQELPARLEHYGRSELKTSDHRPVAAKLAVSVARVDRARMLNVLEDVVAFNGPPDATIVCTLAGARGNFSEELIPYVTAKLDELAVAPIVSRCVNEELLMVMASGVDAVVATSADGVRLAGGETLNVRLRNGDFVAAFMARVAALLDAETEVTEESLNALAAMNVSVDDDEEDEAWMSQLHATPTSHEATPRSRATTPTKDASAAAAFALNGASFPPPLPPPPHLAAAVGAQRPR